MAVLVCSWCEIVVPDATFTNCPNCGGPLPLSNGTDPGPIPPAAPRILPDKFVKRVKYYNNAYTMIGIIFTIPFCWTIIFPIIGVFLWKKGIRIANEELNPLMNGAHVHGTITSVSQDTSIQINGKSPYQVEFLFEFQGRSIAGDVGNLFDPIVLMKNPGDKIWVVFLPEDPNQSSVWPPMK